MDYNFWAAYIVGGIVLFAFSGFVMVDHIKYRSHEAAKGLDVIVLTVLGLIYGAGIVCFCVRYIFS